MEYHLKYQFVLHYYDDLFEYTSRIMNFVKDYYDLIFDKENTLSPATIKELGQTEVILGEIVPYFFQHIPIKNFVLSDEISRNDLLVEIQDYILSYRHKLEQDEEYTIIISLIHHIYG